MEDNTDRLSVEEVEEDIDEQNEQNPFENGGEQASQVAALFDKIKMNETLASRPHCLSRFNNKTPLKCSCLSVMNGREDYCQAVAEFQLMFEKKKSVDRKITVIDWMRNNLSQYKMVFRIPFILHGTEDAEDYRLLRNARICPNAMLDIIKKGVRFWTSCKKHFDQNTIPNHALAGKPPNKQRKFLQVYEAALIDHFDELKKEAEPIATRYVRESTGELTVRDTDEALVFLPSFLTVRSCYAKFCLEKRAAKVSTNNKGKVTVVRADGGAGEVPTVPAWSAYCSYWKRHYPMMKVRRPTEDICNYCYRWTLRHKFRTNAASDTDQQAIETAETIEETVIELVNDEEEEEQNNYATTDLNAPVTVDPDTNTMEQSILEAAEHVKKARSMRSLVNKKIDKARADRQDGLAHSERTYTIIADYCQNMELPHFGKEQPGATYYLTPINLEGFGVADVSYVDDITEKEADHLYFHCYQEGFGAKGGNNVASMIMKTLQQIELLQHDNGAPKRGKELNVVMDNCTGQNKNNMVLLLAAYLVEMGFFEVVNMMFLVVGHTKNICDRRFNNLKMMYHKSQIFTLDQAVEHLNRSEYVTVWKVDTETEWKDYLSMLLKPYKRLARAKLMIKKNHIFTADRTKDPTSNEWKLRFGTRVSGLEEHPIAYGDIINPEFTPEGGNRSELLRSLEPSTLKYKGLPGYKQVLMHDKYRHYVPPEFHDDELYRKPSKDVLDAEEIDQKERKQRKKIKKEELTMAFV